MDNLAIILSHCDTPDKINVLKKQIKRLKDLNIDILLCSHIALEVSIQQEVTYYIYDTDNPILYWPERGCCVWAENMDGKDSVRLESMFPDYGWTVLDQIKKAATFGLPLKYNYYSFINYDALLTPELEFYLVSPSDTPYPIIVDATSGGGTIKSRNAWKVFDAFSLIFTVIRQDVLEKINVRINKPDYLEAVGEVVEGVGAISETYWRKLLSPYDFFVIPFHPRDCMSLDLGDGNQNHFNDDFKVFFQNGNMPDEPHLTKAYFYNIKDNTSIKIQCNDQSYLIEKTSTIDLPTNVTKLGFFDNGAYCDFLPEFNGAKLRRHSIAPVPSI